uniref:Ycf80 n=1 Tax=Spyridia filamentosa TaxID=196632 RepID=A0A1Z1MJB3_SPYFI|nr:hypothetical protein [Spyridia filamentosa]ARW66170.1 hypothetical protein [Spyridia filamentosa]
MILFNLLLSQPIFKNYSNKFQHLIANTDYSINQNIESYSYKNNVLSSKNQLNCFLWANIKNVFSKIYITDNNQHHLISRNFLIRFMNQYWGETIFISTANQYSDFYINKLKSSGLTVYDNDYKRFLVEFSKALLNGKICVKLNTVNNLTLDLSNNSSFSYIKYSWKKGLNFFLSSNLKSFINFFTINNNFYQNKYKLFTSSFPVFTVVNHFDQIVLSESSKEVSISTNFAQTFYRNLQNLFNYTTSHDSACYIGLFFINPYDALEYKSYINNKYLNYSSFLLRNVATKLDVYYGIKYKMNSIDTRLIPDLKEVSTLIHRYQYYQNVTFHEQQEYGKNYFRGQPVYLIQPMISRNKNTKAFEQVAYYYDLKDRSFPHEPIFMNYETALLAWQKFRRQSYQYNLPSKPNLLIFNLEDLFKSNQKISHKSMLLIPSNESYFDVKTNQKSMSRISCLIFNSYLTIKIATKRIIWSLTTRQPVNL